MEMRQASTVRLTTYPEFRADFPNTHTQRSLNGALGWPGMAVGTPAIVLFWILATRKQRASGGVSGHRQGPGAFWSSPVAPAHNSSPVPGSGR